MGGAALLLLLEVRDVLDQRGALRVLFRVAGRGETEGAVVSPDEGGQIAGVREVLELLHVGVPVTPEDHQISDACGKQLVQIGLNARPVGADTGEVSQRLNAQLIFQVGGHLTGRDAAYPGAAGGTGDADKVRLYRLHLLQRLLQGFPIQYLLGREELGGKYTSLLGEELTNIHKDTSLVGKL